MPKIFNLLLNSSKGFASVPVVVLLLVLVGVGVGLVLTQRSAIFTPKAYQDNSVADESGNAVVPPPPMPGGGQDPDNGRPVVGWGASCHPMTDRCAEGLECYTGRCLKPEESVAVGSSCLHDYECSGYDNYETLCLRPNRTAEDRVYGISVCARIPVTVGHGQYCNESYERCAANTSCEQVTNRDRRCLKSPESVQVGGDCVSGNECNGYRAGEAYCSGNKCVPGAP